MNSAADLGAIWPLGKIEGLSEFGCVLFDRWVKLKG